MGSFYGNGWSTGNSEGGTTNYDDLSNKPIVNLTGTENSPINFSDLEYGNYLIKGFYKYSVIDENRQFLSPIMVSVVMDNHTEEKACKYEIVENQDFLIITVYYNGETFTEDRLSLGESGGSSEIAEEVKLGRF